MSVSLTSTLLLGSCGSCLTANFIPAPIQVSGGLSTGAFSKSNFHGGGGKTRTRPSPSRLPTLAITAPPWGALPTLGVKVPSLLTSPSRLPTLAAWMIDPGSVAGLGESCPAEPLGSLPLDV